MSEGIAVIIAAGISVGGMVITVLANVFVNYFARKADAEEKFFYDVYQRRLALYEDVMKELQAMQEVDIKKIIAISPVEISEMTIGKLKTLETLVARLTIFGSANSKKLLEWLRDTMFQFLEVIRKKMHDAPHESDSDSAIAINTAIENTFNAFAVVASQDVSDLADEKIDKFLKKIGYKNKKKDHINLPRT
jgi:hypothetical protein